MFTLPFFIGNNAFKIKTSKGKLNDNYRFYSIFLVPFTLEHIPLLLEGITECSSLWIKLASTVA